MQHVWSIFAIQPLGVHTWQRMYGCQWDDVSEAVNGLEQYGYDGEDFISLDFKNMRYIASAPEALISKHKWDNNPAYLASDKQYFTQICIEWLKKYVQYGKSSLERKGIASHNIDNCILVKHSNHYDETLLICPTKFIQKVHVDMEHYTTMCLFFLCQHFHSFYCIALSPLLIAMSHQFPQRSLSSKQTLG